MPEQLTEQDAENLIVSLLSKANRPLTTREIEEKIQVKDKRCPDSAVRFLSKMRFKDIIKGKLSIEHKGWIWWIENKR